MLVLNQPYLISIISMVYEDEGGGTMRSYSRLSESRLDLTCLLARRGERSVRLAGAYISLGTEGLRVCDV